MALIALWRTPKVFGVRQNKKAKSQSGIGQALGRAIAVRRKALSLTQDDLAGLVEVDAETISRFERGAVLPSLQRLCRVAEALNVGLGELLPQASTLPGDQAQKLTMALHALNKSDQQLLVDFANLLQNR